MEISKVLLKTISLTLDAIFKASNTDIRIHGSENIPDNPLLFVVNHFTRMETFLLPYIINKQNKLYSLSLAHDSLFSGNLGKMLEKLGAISTGDPDRNRILTSSLLTGSNPVIIFPEGQMIKDKKLIEKGKYMIYNAGIRRPPHRGAARFALRTEFFREKIKHFHENGNMDNIKRYKEHFNFEDKDIKSIIEKETYIVPVNITYYPIRVRNNAINKIMDKFVKDISDRIEEEIEVEGAMVIDGVDIDISFGEPISAKEYLYKSKKAKKIIADNNLYLNKGEIRKEAPFRKFDIELMQRYMESIYGMTRVNHDHIFSYILLKSRKSRISETDFKNRAFLAIDKLHKTNITNYHTSLGKKQFYLLTDDFHEKYNSFINAAISEDNITLKDGQIIKHKSIYSRAYKFHAIRKENIIRVLKNEIEPLRDLIKSLNRLILLPSIFVRRKIRNQFINLDRDLFEQDYKEYYIEGETKPKNIGQPFFLKRLFGNRGIILIHGYMAAPEEIRVLSDFLYKKGYIVYGVRLRGHGTAPEDLAIRNWEKWYDSVSRAYIIIKNSVKDFAIAGFSTGGGVALLQAANKENRFKGIISINAPLKLQNISSRLSSVIVLWNKFLKKINVSKGKMEFVTNDPENPHINYFRNPISGVHELEKLMNIVEDRLKYITTPTLIIQGSNDPVVNPVSGLEIFDKIGTDNKELFRIYSNRHGIVRGKESEKVKSIVYEFLRKVF